MTSPCAGCGARYADADDSCEVRFGALLALDHSRREPWGSRHGQAFAVFALQHPHLYARSLDHSWAALHQIYVAGGRPEHVFKTLIALEGAFPATWRVPPRLDKPIRAPDITIADMEGFAPATYPAQLDAWCRATLESWGVVF